MRMQIQMPIQMQIQMQIQMPIRMPIQMRIQMPIQLCFWKPAVFEGRHGWVIWTHAPGHRGLLVERRKVVNIWWRGARL